MPNTFIDREYFGDPYIRGEASPYDCGITVDAYTKAEVDQMFDSIKSKIYKLLSDINIDISEEDFYEALKL